MPGTVSEHSKDRPFWKRPWSDFGDWVAPIILVIVVEIYELALVFGHPHNGWLRWRLIPIIGTSEMREE